MRRKIYFISDGTGITVESLGKSLLLQFDKLDYDCQTIPFVNEVEKAEECVAKFHQDYKDDAQRPIVFVTIVDPAIAKIIQQSDALLIDIFQAFIAPLEQAFNQAASHRVGLLHAQNDFEQYHQRIAAINFSQANDDGCSTKNFEQADVIILGVSRSGKTPTCLYLALNYGLNAANYPLTEDDMPLTDLPAILKPYQDKLFGLTIDPMQLQKIRSERRPNSGYAAKTQCYYEVEQVEKLYERHILPYLDSTHSSIEEIAARINAWARH